MVIVTTTLIAPNFYSVTGLNPRLLDYETISQLRRTDEHYYHDNAMLIVTIIGRYTLPTESMCQYACLQLSSFTVPYFKLSQFSGISRQSLKGIRTMSQ